MSKELHVCENSVCLDQIFATSTRRERVYIASMRDLRKTQRISSKLYSIYVKLLYIKRSECCGERKCQESMEKKARSLRAETTRFARIGAIARTQKRAAVYNYKLTSRFRNPCANGRVCLAFFPNRYCLHYSPPASVQGCIRASTYVHTHIYACVCGKLKFSAAAERMGSRMVAQPEQSTG